MANTRKNFRILHLWLGLISGLVVFVVTITGALLVFEDEIKETFNKDFYFVQPQAKRLSVDSLVSIAKSYTGVTRVKSIVANVQNPESTVIITVKQKQTLKMAINPYTGNIIGLTDPDKDVFKTILQLHRYLCLKKTGKAITGVSCVIFLSLIITGLVLWWPKNRKRLKQRLQIKRNASAKRINWELHAVGGFYIHLFIFIFAATGLVWSYRIVNKAIFYVFDGKPQQKNKTPQNTVIAPIQPGFFEDILTATNKKLTNKGPVSITIPVKKEQVITVSKTNEDAAITNVVDYLYFEKGTGRIIKERLYKNESRGMKVRRLIYPIHTGNIFGWPTKIIAFISCLVAASLPITGLRIWLVRNKGKKKKVPPTSRPSLSQNPSSGLPSSR